MAANENDLLARFIENEKSARTWTLVSVSLFVILAFGILYLMNELKKANDETETANLATAKALAKADSVVNELEKFKKTAENIALNPARQGGAIAAPRPDTPPDRNSNRTNKKNITVFLQYKKEYKAQCQLLMDALKAEKYNVPGKEWIKNINFTTSVKYFNEQDKPWADSIAVVMNKIIGRTKSNPVPVIKNSVKAPRGQLEVWMGDYKRTVTSDLIKKYSSNQLQTQSL
ncbi:hypothetical protein [Dyadobacter sp. NIV53]|uniref:hypothetical protein n=1 Tax=Dyadobacter sp. NIV53 TaxID=2861765 RepID=UPI001C86CD50|nr:hypothetical protein [Dyadobacter sp. NIV53]